jgi:hypothetical protein
MFFRKRKPPTDITAAAYRRWLRAGRPPFDIFLGLDEDSQEGLAELGDAHTQDLCEALAATILEPHALLAGAEIGEQPEPDSALALAQNVAEKLTMGGTGGRRHVRPQSQRPVGTMFGAEGEKSP